MFSDITNVTLYDTLGADSTKYIINQTEMKSVFCTSNHVRDLSELKKSGGIPSLQNLILYDAGSLEDKKLAEDAGLTILMYDQVVNSGRFAEVDIPDPTTDSVFTICYTSGTTGDPKGVMLSHKNLLCLATGLDKVNIEINERDIHLSYLPLAHVFERAVLHCMLMKGAAVGFFAGDVFKLKDDIAALRPTIFISVPRLFNRFFDGMMGKIKELKGFKGTLANWGLQKKLSNLEKTGETANSIFDKLVFNKFREAMGGRIKFMLTGSAPISKDVLNFLKVALCCPVYEGYGQTETTAASSITLEGDPEVGHVGGVMPYSELKLVDIPDMDYRSTDEIDGVKIPRGEICYRGHNNF